jgi:hypothetical protein
MADVPSRARPTTSPIPGLDDPVPAPDDPGGAHGKGYIAELGPDQDLPERDPVPLPPDTEEGRKPQVRQIAEGIEANIPGTRLPSGSP